MFAGTKQVRHLWWLGGLAIFLQEVISLLGLGPLLNSLVSLNNATHGILSPTLVISLVIMAINVGILLILIGRLKPSDVGLLRGKILPGILYTVLIYLTLQLISLLLQLVTGGSLALSNDWQGGVSSNLLGQWLGNALYEEIFWRGFWFVQLGLVFRVVWTKQPWLCLGVALLLSQTLFALSHIPQRILIVQQPLDYYPLGLATLIFDGILFALIYYRTGNLFLAMGVHALYNQAPPRLLALNGDHYRLIFYAVILLVIVAWPFLTRQGQTFQASSAPILQPADD